ncbi:hypothetical protein C8F01DRAFT_1086821 [Mycena amicta]|nr:hypothetical protein C8F01DRAFT_1086821 [Mycena amicta]
MDEPHPSSLSLDEEQEESPGVKLLELRPPPGHSKGTMQRWYVTGQRHRLNVSYLFWEAETKESFLLHTRLSWEQSNHFVLTNRSNTLHQSLSTSRPLRSCTFDHALRELGLHTEPLASFIKYGIVEREVVALGEKKGEGGRDMASVVGVTLQTDIGLARALEWGGMEVRSYSHAHFFSVEGLLYLLAVNEWGSRSELSNEGTTAMKVEEICKA